MNYYPERDGAINQLDKRLCTTSEMVQRHLEGAIVVKAFHNVNQFHLRSGPRPVGDPKRWALPIAGDIADAKTVVSAFMAAVGFDPVDCGLLSESWRIQQNTPGYSLPYIGELPSGATTRELFEWVKHDHSRVVKEADVRAMAAKASNSGRSERSSQISRRSTLRCLQLHLMSGEKRASSLKNTRSLGKRQ